MTGRRRSDCFGVGEFASGARRLPVAPRAAARLRARWGLDADPRTPLLPDAELKRANIQRPINPIGIGHCGPILVKHGSEEQKNRYIMPMLSADEIWCQLFSEPEAGSDLAN